MLLCNHSLVAQLYGQFEHLFKIHIYRHSSETGFNGNYTNQVVVINDYRPKHRDVWQALFHVLGRYYEHQRPDRSDHVIVIWDNVREGNNYTDIFSLHTKG